MTITYPARSSTVELAGEDGSTLRVPISIGPITVPSPAPDGGHEEPPPPKGDRIRAVWHQGWHGPAIDTWPTDILDAITHISVDMCQSASPGTGLLADPPGLTVAQVDAAAQHGVKVHAGIGGSGGGGIRLFSDVHRVQMLSSIKSMRDRLHIAGVTLDLEDAPGGTWTVPTVTALAHDLVEDGIGVAICSSLWGGRLQAWGIVASSLGPALSWWERMFYDFTEARDSRLSEIVTSKQLGLGAMAHYVNTRQQLVATFMPNDAGDANASPVPVLTAAYRAGAAAFPGAGWSVFHDWTDAGAGWAATRALMAA